MLLLLYAYVSLCIRGYSLFLTGLSRLEGKESEAKSCDFPANVARTLYFNLDIEEWPLGEAVQCDCILKGKHKIGAGAGAEMDKKAGWTAVEGLRWTGMEAKIVLKNEKCKKLKGLGFMVKVEQKELLTKFHVFCDKEKIQELMARLGSASWMKKWFTLGWETDWLIDWLIEVLGL